MGERLEETLRWNSNEGTVRLEVCEEQNASASIIVVFTPKKPKTEYRIRLSGLSAARLGQSIDTLAQEIYPVGAVYPKEK